MYLSTFKTQYQALQSSLKTDFIKNPDSVEWLVSARSKGVDALLKKVWQNFKMSTDLCLVAVGGYGRGELHLCSDIDLLILMPSKSHKKHQDSIAKFLTFLWDIGLEVGHATRDIADCVSVISDLSVVTNLLESRLILGKKSLFLQMQIMIKSQDWSSRSFFVAKQKEQYCRHKNFSNTAYNLEPNIKENPGGLRDIQTLAWVVNWCLDVQNLFAIGSSYLSKNELDLLKKAQIFLWKVRFALHIQAERREDRLLFQHQKQVAQMLGYINDHTMAVEIFMKDYYQNVTKISRLNDVLLQLLEERLLNTQTLNKRFVIEHGYIQASNEKIFVKHPSAFIEIFLLFAKHRYVRGIGAKTLRQMRGNINIIDENYHQQHQNSQLFIEILQQKNGVNEALKLMNRYGVLERYIPVFGKIIGLMQYDLFHIWTVDQHTLFVIRNLRRFFVSEFSQEFNLCSKIAQTIKKPELLLLAGLFHDIAKGRGGEHAKLGAQDASQFCQSHQLKSEDIKLVTGLVEQHLLMSQVAQKQDIDDTEVIKKFAKSVGSITFLEFLYLLTVADIRATRDDLWNDWKDSLLKRLFYNTQAYLKNGTKQLEKIDQNAKIIKQNALEIAITQGYELDFVEALFATLPNDYFLSYKVDDILWHVSLNVQCKNLMVATKISVHNVVDIFVMCEDDKGVFVKLLNALERLGLNIVNAKILTTKDQKAYNTISVLQDTILKNVNINQIIEKALFDTKLNIRSLENKRSHQYFDQKIQTLFTLNEKWQLTQLDINALDKQGILSNIAYVFFKLDIKLVNAKIATMGERVEDVFFISNSKNQPLDIQQQLALKTTLEERL